MFFGQRWTHRPSPLRSLAHATDLSVGVDQGTIFATSIGPGLVLVVGHQRGFLLGLLSGLRGMLDFFEKCFFCCLIDP